MIGICFNRLTRQLPFMDDEFDEAEPQYLIKDEAKWLEVQKYRIDLEKYQTEKYLELGNRLVDSYKEYATSGRRMITTAVFIFIAIIFIAMAVLTFFGKVSGETFAFVTGTIVGYIISILKQNL